MIYSNFKRHLKERHEETQAEAHTGTMDKDGRRNGPLFGFSCMDQELVGIVGCAVHLRRLYYKTHPLDMVERSRKSCDAHGDELGGCHRIRFGGCVFRQYLFFPKLYDTIVVA